MDKFELGDKVIVDSTNVIMLNCGREFTVTNLKPYKDTDIFIEITNEYEQANVNKKYLKLNKSDN